MNSDEYEVSYFRYCHSLIGALEPIDVARRNGRLVPCFPQSLIAGPPGDTAAEESAEYRQLVEEVCQNLNKIERRTWLRILEGRPILDVAIEEHVSRTAIYDRIRRMVEKNAYCAIWWQLKNKVNQHT